MYVASIPYVPMWQVFATSRNRARVAESRSHRTAHARVASSFPFAYCTLTSHEFDTREPTCILRRPHKYSQISQLDPRLHMVPPTISWANEQARLWAVNLTVRVEAGVKKRYSTRVHKEKEDHKSPKAFRHQCLAIDARGSGSKGFE